MTSEHGTNGEMRRIALTVAYEGTDYAGFQWQANAPTIQGELELAIRKLTGVGSRVRGASRTDSGAHACRQVVDFASSTRLASSVFVPGLNHFLPAAIRVAAATEVPWEFHSRFSASFREYRYSILNRKTHSPLLRRSHHLVNATLDLTAIRMAATSLIGVRDFRNIATGHPADRSAVRQVFSWDVRRNADEPDVITIDCAATGFLRHQIRRVNAILLEIGKHKLPVHAMAEALGARVNDNLQIPMLPAHGLCLKAVHYPEYDHLLKVELNHETDQHLLRKSR